MTSSTFISLSLLFLIPRIHQVIFIDHRDAALAENYCKLPHWKTKPCLWLYNMYHTEHSMLPTYSLQTLTQTCYPHLFSPGVLLAQTVQNLLYCNIYRMRCLDDHERRRNEIQALLWRVWEKNTKICTGDVSNSPGEIPTSKRIPCTCVSHLSREITNKRTVVK